MYALNFEYDKHCLSDFGFIICDFNASSGVNFANAGSKITFNTVPRHRGRKFGLVNTKYDECIQATFHICKDPELFDDLQITHDEYRDIMRWLNRGEYLRFQILYDRKANHEVDACFYFASFNIQKITIGDILYGLELSMHTDAPFGFGPEHIITLNVDNPNKKHIVYDVSDDICTFSPSMTITCRESGNLMITNESIDSVLYIKNVSVGEIIDIDGDALIITTSKEDHDICEDYNYEFLKIGNSYKSRENLISANLLCDIEIRYSPIVKESP